ncbi:MAG: DNA-formamidopyrimidine glycosylase family protein [Gemmatimonadaceae bacterium]
MPELPEVERAVVELRRFTVGRRITALELHHAALKRRMTPAQRRSIRGARVVAVRRRGKHQLLDLDDGRVLHAHFRMSGAWKVGAAASESRYPRATLALDDGSAIVLDDPRALSSIVLVAAGADPIASLGPDADDPSVGAAWLVARLSKRKSAIKVVLLDQTVLSGIGNIYAAESLWHSRLDPRRPANDLTPPEVRRLLKSIRVVLRRASGARYDGDGRFDVYDREGEKCRRCKSAIERFPQAGRSTYSCPRCQR